MVVGAFFGIAFLWDWNENILFFCFFAFLFLEDGLDPCLLYNVTTSVHSSSGTLSDLVP